MRSQTLQHFSVQRNHLFLPEPGALIGNSPPHDFCQHIPFLRFLCYGTSCRIGAKHLLQYDKTSIKDDITFYGRYQYCWTKYSPPSQMHMELSKLRWAEQNPTCNCWMEKQTKLEPILDNIQQNI